MNLSPVPLPADFFWALTRQQEDNLAPAYRGKFVDL